MLGETTADLGNRNVDRIVTSYRLAWGWALLLTLALLGAAWMTRYSYEGRAGEPPAYVIWDRWRHRICAFNAQATMCLTPGPARPERFDRP
jgi:hypothetical protein